MGDGRHKQKKTTNAIKQGVTSAKYMICALGEWKHVLGKAAENFSDLTNCLKMRLKLSLEEHIEFRQ